MNSWGEEWGFWGGKVEDGETIEQAAQREIREELGYELQNPIYIGRFADTRIKPGTDEVWHLVFEAFAEKTSEDLSQFVVHEGAGIGLFTIKQAKNLRVGPLDIKVYEKMDEFLSKQG